MPNRSGVFKGVVIGFLLILLGSHLSYGQWWNEQLRKLRNQNRKTSTFTGRKLRFANAQEYLTLGGGIIAMNYYGDIAPEVSPASTDLSFTRPGININSTLRIGPRFSIRAGLMWGRLKSDDYSVSDPNTEKGSQRFTRNLHFRNDIKELSITATVDMFANNGTVSDRLILVPYAFAGISVFHHNPRAKVPDEAYLYNIPGQSDPSPEVQDVLDEYSGDYVALQPLGTEGQYATSGDTPAPYSNFQVSIPFGVGLRYKLNALFDLELEFGFRHLFFDYIDDVSNNYVDKGIIKSKSGDKNILAKLMSDRSLEPESAVQNEDRLSQLYGNNYQSGNYDDGENPPPAKYTGADGEEYSHVPGYGQPREIRGGPDSNDTFLTTTIRLVWMFGPNPFSNKNNPRFR